jgi:hypothetical protein
MANKYNILAKPPPDDDKKGWYRWFYTLTDWVNALRMGSGNTNYTQFEDDGTMVAVGDATCYDDLIGAITAVQVLGTGVSLNATEQSMDFTAAAAYSTDYGWFSFQMKHAWAAGTTIHPHLHWEQASANVPNWLMEYRWQINGGTKVTAWTKYKTNTPAFTYVSGTLNQICSGGAITPPVGYSLSDILQFRLYRDTSNASGQFTGADPYSGTVKVTSVDIHIQIDMLGSHTEYSK